MSSRQFFNDHAPKTISIKPQHEGGGVCESSHVKLMAVFFHKVHSLNMELVQFL